MFDNEEEEIIYSCNECGHESYDIDEFVCINGDLYCESCYCVCDDCGEYCLETFETDNGNDICQSCRWDHYYNCESCGALIHEDDSYRRHGDILCQSCYEESRDDIREYHDTPTWYQRSMDDSEDLQSPKSWMKLIGIELEMQDGDRNSFVSRVRDISDDERVFYLMHDGSLDDETGVECISQPMTYEYFKERFPLKQLCSYAKYECMKSHDTNQCGLHIHASKAYFGNNEKEQRETLLKVVYLLDFYRYDLVYQVSRRDYDEFNTWSRPLNLNTRTDYNDFYNQNDHRSIINERNNTYELRCFNGTLKESSIIASVDLYIGLINFCRSHSWELIDKMNLNDLMSYLAEDNKELKAYFEYRKIAYQHNDLIYTKLALLQVDIERENEIKAQLWNNVYSAINPVIETYYSGYYRSPREHIITDHTMIMNDMDENIHFLNSFGNTQEETFVF